MSVQHRLGREAGGGLRRSDAGARCRARLSGLSDLPVGGIAAAAGSGVRPGRRSQPAGAVPGARRGPPQYPGARLPRCAARRPDDLRDELLGRPDVSYRARRGELLSGALGLRFHRRPRLPGSGDRVPLVAPVAGVRRRRSPFLPDRRPGQRRDTRRHRIRPPREPLVDGRGSQLEGERQHADRRVQWQNDFYEAMRLFSTGGAYQNFVDPSLTDWPTAYYGSNLTALQCIKARVDPDRVFAFPQAIPPTRCR